MSTCYELVIYSVKPHKINDYNNLHNDISDQMSKKNGFISSSCEKSATKEHTFTDKVIWENKKAALLAYKEFKTFSKKKHFRFFGLAI